MIPTKGEDIHVCDKAMQLSLRDGSPEMFALSRTTYPEEAPKGRKLELIKQQMLRIQRAAGHPSFQNLGASNLRAI